MDGFPWVIDCCEGGREMEDDEFAAKPSSGKELLSTWRIGVLRCGEIFVGEENQLYQENGDEMMQTGGQNYQRRD